MSESFPLNSTLRPLTRPVREVSTEGSHLEVNSSLSRENPEGPAHLPATLGVRTPLSCAIVVVRDCGVV